LGDVNIKTGAQTADSSASVKQEKLAMLTEKLTPKFERVLTNNIMFQTPLHDWVFV
jgi:hypothetical protein